MFSVDWLSFLKIIELMETKYNGWITFREAVFAAGLPRCYRGDTYVPNFLRHKIAVILPKGEVEQLYVLKNPRKKDKGLQDDKK
jgi:hypothetical protein